MILGNLDFKIGSVNPSGIGTTIYRIAKRLIAAWPTIVDDPDSAQSSDGPSVLSSYSGSFTLVEGAVWDKIYSTQGKGSMSFEPVGETDCKMFNNKLQASFPDLTPAALGWSKTAANDDYVYIGKSAGRYHIIGSPDYRCVTSPQGTSGDAAGSAKGVTIDVECPDVTPLPLYVGNIVTAEGSLNCSTGVFTPVESDDN